VTEVTDFAIYFSNLDYDARPRFPTITGTACYKAGLRRLAPGG